MRRRRKGPEHYHKLLRECGKGRQYQGFHCANTHPVFMRDICEKRQLSADRVHPPIPRGSDKHPTTLLSFPNDLLNRPDPHLHTEITIGIQFPQMFPIIGLTLAV